MARARSGGGPLPLQESDPSLPEDVRALISKAKDSWLKNAEIFRILTCLWDGAVVDLAREAPVQPEGTCRAGLARQGLAMWHGGAWHACVSLCDAPCDEFLRMRLRCGV